ncbi:GTPase IMAP family member 8 isoform X1 [Alosa alosa]|uniref:GTPase IMAP family member 8 isoform X1 n=1 Tax=Alosa alosa TaxID=278164 RepID=UPI0020153AE5|nr:GTPase IMAP family member 8 isoform X1 [Alosa alosa]
MRYLIKKVKCLNGKGLNESVCTAGYQLGGPGQPLSELRIILIGGRNSGKMCVGNTIIGAEEFVTRERTTCLRRQAKVLGKHVIVTDTPGWWCDFHASDTPELVKKEIVRSVTLSLPGPHIFLLVIKVDSAFTEKRRRAVQEHLELLGEAAWRHTCVIFTKGEHSNKVAIENHIKRGGRPLEWILEKCGKRYHALYINCGHDMTQSVHLLEKIEVMIAGIGGLYFEMDQHILREVEDCRSGTVLRAQQRWMRVKSQRCLLSGQSKPLDKLSLVLLGARGSGKSSVGNTIISGQEEFNRKRRTAHCVTKTCRVSGRQVSLVDTPGWWMNYYAQDSPASMKRELMRSAHLCPPGPHCFLLVVRVDKAFTVMYARALQEHVELLSERVWNHTIVLFSFGDWLGDTTIEQYIESEGRAIQWLVEKCGNRYHVFNNKSKGDGFQVTMMLEKIDEMLAGNSGHLYEKDEKIFMELEKRRKADKGRARDRAMKVGKQRKVLRSLVEMVKVPTDLKITLLGERHSGKSAAGNTILSREEFEVGGHDIDLVEKKGDVAGRELTVIKVPALDSVALEKYNFIEELSLHAHGCGVLLLVVNCSSSFHNVEFKATVSRLSALGKQLWHRTMVLFTNGDWLGGTTIEQHIESEGEPLQKLVENCGNRYHILDNKNRDDRGQVSELLEKIEEMLVLVRLKDQKYKDAVDATVMGLSAKLEKLKTNNNAGTPEGISLSQDRCPMERAGVFNNLGVSESPNVSDITPAQERPHGLARPAGERCICDAMVAARSSSAVIQINDGWQWPSVNAGRRVLVANVPEWLCSGVSQGPRGLGSNGWTPVSTDGSLAWLVVTPVSKRQSRMLLGKEDAEHMADCVESPSSPTKQHDQRHLKEFIKSGSLQALIDEWGDSNIEELEAFIDSYLEMVLQESVESALTEPSSSDTSSSIKHAGVSVVEACHEVLSSIDRKLSKLGLIDGMQRDLQELKSTLERSSKIIQDLMDPGRQTADNSVSKQAKRQCEDNTLEIKER